MPVAGTNGHVQRKRLFFEGTVQEAIDHCSSNNTLLLVFLLGKVVSSKTSAPLIGLEIPISLDIVCLYHLLGVARERCRKFCALAGDFR